MFKRLRDRRQSREEKLDELLSAYLDGMLPLDERAALEARLRQEPALLNRLEGLRKTKKALATLPEVEIPRNFILSPSMVAPQKPTPRPRRRPAWSIFGWATAAATLLFLLVFAGDVFVLAPSQRPQPARILSEQPTISTETLGEAETDRSAQALAQTSAAVEATVEVVEELEAQTAAPPAVAEAEATLEVEKEAKAPTAQNPEGAGTEVPQAALRAETPETYTEAEAPTEAVVEEEAVRAAEAQEGTAEVEDMITESAQAPTASLEFAAPEAGGGAQVSTGEAGETALQAAASPTAGLETREVEAGQAGGPAVTPAPSVGAQPPEEEAEVPLVVSPPAAQERDDRDAEQATPLTAAVIAAVELTPTPAGTTQAADRLLSALRVVEFSLGVSIMCLAAVTLILRRRDI